MTCKDCIHYEACKNLYEIHGDGLSGESHVCDYFADRSRFVELPCEVGDMVYFIKGDRVMSDVVTRFVIDKCDVRVRKSNGADVGHTSQFGTRIFLTREEAERALKLKERENDAE